jgi:DNA polymerase III delta subunit
MFGPRRVVVVDEADPWLAGFGNDDDPEGDSPGAGRKKARNQEMDAVLGLLHQKNAAGLLILIAKQVDARLKLLRELQTLGALLDLSPFDDQSSPRSFVLSLFRERGVRVDDEAVTFLLDAIGESVDALTLEVEKLSDHAGDTRIVTLDDAQAMVQRLRGHKYWDLADATVRRDARQSLVILSRMFDSLVDSKTKVNAAGLPLVLLAVLAGRFEQLAAVHQASDQRLEELSLSLQTGPKPVNLWLLRKLRGEAQEFTRSELEDILSKMKEVDGRLKSTSHSPRVLLESLVVTICTRAPRWHKRQSSTL